jgi:hypothetical protein
MAKKKFLIEVEEGRTECNSECLLKLDGKCVDADEGVANIIHFLLCDKYNLATMKITEMEEQQ